MSRPAAPLLTILEGRWFPRKNVSLRDMFLPFLTVWTKNGDGAHHYEMFTNASSFSDAIAHAFAGGHSHTIYIAAHGSRTGIKGFHDDGISRAKVRHALRRAKPSQRRRGVYFGSCLFGTQKNAEFLLNECPRVAWIVGYTTSVDWVDSSVLDLFFLRHYLFPEPGPGVSRPRTQLQRLAFAVERVRAMMHELAFSVGFRVYTRKRGGNGGVREIFLEGTA